MKDKTEQTPIQSPESNLLRLLLVFGVRRRGLVCLGLFLGQLCEFEPAGVCGTAARQARLTKIGFTAPGTPHFDP